MRLFHTYLTGKQMIVSFQVIHFNPIEDKTQNLIGGIGAKFSNELVKDLFGISALVIPFVSLIVSPKNNRI